MSSLAALRRFRELFPGVVPGRVSRSRHAPRAVYRGTRSVPTPLETRTDVCKPLDDSVAGWGHGEPARPGEFDQCLAHRFGGVDAAMSGQPCDPVPPARGHGPVAGPERWLGQEEG